MSAQHYVTEAANSLQRGRFSDACNAAEAALRDDPAHTEARLILGLASLQLGRNEAALRNLAEVVERQPQRTDARYNLALACHRAGRADAARRCYRQVLEQVPGQIESSCNLAELLSEERRFADAVEVLRACLAHHPGDSRVGVFLAGALADAGAADEAVELCRRRLVESPGDMRFHNQLARALAAAGQQDDAIAHCRTALSKFGHHAEVGTTLGRLLLEAGDSEGAITRFRAVLAEAPDRADAVNGLAVALHRAGRGREAAEILETATRRLPGSAQTWFNLGAVYSDLEKNKYLDRAESATRRAIELRPDHAEAHACLGLIAGKTDRPDLAIASLQRAVELAPRIYDARINLADTLERAGRRDAAIDVLAAAIELEPDAPAAYRQTGIFHLRARRPTEAVTFLREAYRRDMLDQRTVAHLAVALEETGEDREAAFLKGMDRFVFPLRPPPPPGWESIAEFNAEFGRDILAHPSLQWEPVGLAARGGSLTGNLLDAPTPAIEAWETLLRESIDALIASLGEDPSHPFLKRLPHRYRLNSWACVVPEGGVIDTHIHEESWLSGAYYVALPDGVGRSAETHREGWIEFGRPTREIPVSREPQLRLVRPEEGMLVLFPSYLYHRTLPFRGGGNRISVSFDLERLDEQ